MTMQAALLMNKLKAMGSTAAAASAASAASFATSDSSGSGGNKKQSRKKNSAAAGMDSSKLSKNTVANLLAASRFATGGGASQQNESDSESKPELTIEPIFKGYKPDQSSQSGDEGSVTSTVEDGKLKIKTVSETPEIRNLSDQSLNHQEELRNNASGADEDESDDGAAGRAYGKYATVETEELRCPLKMGWKREITVREYSKSGIRGDVLYYAPCGKKFKQYPDIMRYLEKKA